MSSPSLPLRWWLRNQLLDIKPLNSNQRQVFSANSNALGCQRRRGLQTQFWVGKSKTGNGNSRLFPCSTQLVCGKLEGICLKLNINWLPLDETLLSLSTKVVSSQVKPLPSASLFHRAMCHASMPWHGVMGWCVVGPATSNQPEENSNPENRKTGRSNRRCFTVTSIFDTIVPYLPHMYPILCWIDPKITFWSPYSKKHPQTAAIDDHRGVKLWLKNEKTSRFFDFLFYLFHSSRSSTRVRTRVHVYSWGACYMYVCTTRVLE